MTAHTLATCQQCDGCAVCLGGLAYCTVCGGAEGSMPTDCLGRFMSYDEVQRVEAGTLDYIDGQWVVK